jgi:23S rRNA pseudouridine1911/1915/1917 synthase
MQIVYEDNHLLVALKPAGLPTQPDCIERLKKILKKKYQKSGNVFLEPIHRLDKPVSGLILCAKSSKALSRLHALMRDRQIEKRYCALVSGALPSTEGELRHFLMHDSHRARVVPPSHPEAKEALLRYRILQRKQNKSFVEIELVTGRYHQIRAQFAAIGCPIIGDAKYGSAHSWPHEGIALHHARMKFVHPVTHQELVFKAPFLIV